MPRYEVNAKVEYTRTDSGGGAIYVGEDYIVSLTKNKAGRWVGGKMFDYANGRAYALAVNPQSGKVVSCKLERVSSNLHAPFVVFPIINSDVSDTSVDDRPGAAGLPKDIRFEWGWQEIYKFAGDGRATIVRGVSAEAVESLCDAAGDKSVAAIFSANPDAFPGPVGEAGQLVEWAPKEKRAVVFVPGAKAEEVVKAYEESAKGINPKAAKPFTQLTPQFPDENVWFGSALLKNGRSRVVEVYEYARIHRDGKPENGSFVVVYL